MSLVLEKTADTFAGTPVVDHVMGPVALSKFAVRSKDVSPQIP